MKGRTVILTILIVGALLSAGAALAAGGAGAHQSGYHITSWAQVPDNQPARTGDQTRLESAGGVYRLQRAAPLLTGSGCCCNYLPCVESNPP